VYKDGIESTAFVSVNNMKKLRKSEINIVKIINILNYILKNEEIILM